MRSLVLALACLVTPAAAQEAPVVLDPGAVLALAAEPWRDRVGFVARLEAVLGPVSLDRADLPEAQLGDDPFLWSLTGRFGAPLPGSSVAGGIVACARYGLATRDRLSGTAFSDREVFTLFAATQPANDDLAAWPETGLARLACMITRDDTPPCRYHPRSPRARGGLCAVYPSVCRMTTPAFGARARPLRRSMAPRATGWRGERVGDHRPAARPRADRVAAEPSGDPLPVLPAQRRHVRAKAQPRWIQPPPSTRLPSVS